MRQVNRDELEWIFRQAFRSLGQSVKIGLSCADSEKRHRYERIAATVFAEKMERLEVLSEAPEPPAFRSG